MPVTGNAAQLTGMDDRPVTRDEVEATLTQERGEFFFIDDLRAYAEKVIALGKSIVTRREDTQELLAYILYYDDGPTAYVTMIWTRPDHRGRGLAGQLLHRLVRVCGKDVELRVHRDNPAATLYQSVGFVVTDANADELRMIRKRRLAIMQPYIFPYVGYFHLCQASDLFVFYDDVQYTIKGWINRNRILLEGRDYKFTVPVVKASQNRQILETQVAVDSSWRERFGRTLTQAYRNAPQFGRVAELVMSVFDVQEGSISDLAINSVRSVYEYLGLQFPYLRSSLSAPLTLGMDKADRLIAIAKSLGYSRYVNAPGGERLYDRTYFAAHGIELGFVKSGEIRYRQLRSDAFVPSLSIIDVLMFNEPDAVRRILNDYVII